MAKFCIHCGKPLEEGEVCSCHQATAETVTQQPEGNEKQVSADNGKEGASVNQSYEQANNTDTANNGTNTTNNSTSTNTFGEKLKFVFAKFSDYFKSPTGTIKEFAAKNDSNYGILMICINLMVVFLLALILINSSVSALSHIPFISSMLGNSAFPIAFMLTAIFAAYYFSLAGMLVLTTKSMFKGSLTFSQTISIVGVNAFLNAVILVTSILLMLISPALGLIVFYVGMLYTSLITYVSYFELSDISSDKKIYALLISIIGVFLAVFICSLLMGAIVGPSMSNSFNDGYTMDYYDFY